MRIQTYALGISMAVSATVLGFAGCGGSVNQTTGGSTGSGGHTTTVSASSSGSTTTGMSTAASSSSSSSASSSSSSSSSGAGGGTPCDQACTHIKTCTGFTCMQAGIDCATMGSQYDCQFECAAQTPCSQLGPATLQKCQAQCADGGTTDGGMPSMACQTCAGQHCQSQTGACVQDMTCGKWLQCVGVCNQQAMPPASCFTACDTMYVSAKPLYGPIYACACASCKNECAASDPCNH